MATTASRSSDRYPPQQEPSTTSNGLARTSSQPRSGRHRDEVGSDYPQGSVMPPAPEVPRGPPVSYRQPMQDQSPLAPSSAKSFSERVRASPRQNLVDQEPWSQFDELEIGNGGRNSGRLQTRQRQPEYEEYPPQSPIRAEAPPRQQSLRESRPQAENVMPRTQSHNLPHIDTTNNARAADKRHDTAKMNSPISRSGSERRPSTRPEQESGEFASARSPLQKLELTLNGISKEEKRARVAEAEMLLRESLAAKGARQTSRDVEREQNNAPSRRQSQKAGKAPVRATDDTVPRRNVSTSQRNRSEPSAVRQREDEGTRRPSVQAREVPYDQEDQVQAMEDDDARNLSSYREHEKPMPQRHPAHELQSLSQESTVPYRASPPTGYDAPTSGLQRSGTSRRARAEQIEHSIPSHITRAVSSQQKQPYAKFQDDVETPRSGPAHEQNASHKGALMEGAAVAGAAANGIGRSNSRKLQKDPPKKISSWGESNRAHRPNDSDTSVEQPVEQTAQFYTRGTPKQIEIQKSSSKRAPPTVGLGLNRASMDQPNAPGNAKQDKHHLSEMFHHKPRPQSVSFKQPFDRARPVDEWKDAGVARLSLSDFDLSDMEKNKAWWESSGSGRRRSRRSTETARRIDPATNDPRKIKFDPPLFLKCGPLLRYTGLKRDKLEDTRGDPVEKETWRGSVMIVTQDAQSSYEYGPTLRLFSQPMELLPPPPAHVNDESNELAPEYVDPLAGLTSISRTGQYRYVRPIDHIEPEKDLSRIENDDGLFEQSPSAIVLQDGKTVDSPNKRAKTVNGETVGKYREVQGHRIYADLIRGVTFWRFYLEVELGEHQAHVAYRINNGAPIGFWVPARGQSMNIMFHSCNGFSLSVKPDVFSGPDPLWRDVLNTHQTRPFHVMIGGGDQIYNDRVMIETTHFSQWLKLKNPHEKHHAEFTTEMAEELETFYLERYSMWFSQGLFSMANSQIPMVNVWDDHDIIDGFGSYPDHFMRAPVFSGLGNIAFKYYMLFQHQSVPEEKEQDEPSWLLGIEPGPYITQRSRNLFMFLGKGIAFLGLDCRTERKRDIIMSNDTIDQVLERCRREIVEGDTKHLIVLLGVPIAYPRLVWLENVLTSRAMDPIKALGRAGVLKGGFLNKFDGGVEILDDLDDHWTASGHKAERQDLINDLQDLAAEKSVRITILGGDVHLAAVGQFYTNPKYKIPKDRDHRYMPNVISSAIVNTPPGEMLADILNKRNKVHHFDEFTDEDMIPMFTHDVDGKRRNNKCLLPRRNWASIREYFPGSTPPPTPSPPATPTESERSFSPPPPRRSFSLTRNDVKPSNILRHLSLRGKAPPSSYRDESYVEGRPTSAENSPMRRHSIQQESFSPPRNDSPNPSRQSLDQQLRKAPVIPRPGNFQRRPTNLSERAAKKGGGMALDGEGDFNDHVNLEGGLDIILNVEASRADPAGITTPYRLLVPALYYDGTSDAMHNEVGEGEGLKRSASLFKRLGLGGRRKNAWTSKEHGDWEQDDGAQYEDRQNEQPLTPTGGYNGVEAYREPKRRWF